MAIFKIYFNGVNGGYLSVKDHCTKVVAAAKNKVNEYLREMAH